MDNTYTNLIYLNQDIEIIEKNGQKSIFSKNNLKKFDLLLVEHVITATPEIAFDIVKNNTFLFNQLHPRNLSWKNDKELEELVWKKIKKNSFKSTETCLTFGCTVSNFNHHCICNTKVIKLKSYLLEGLYIDYIGVYTITDIFKGQELKINYGNGRGHVDDDFQCDCGKTLPERIQIDKQFQHLYDQLENQKDLALKYITEYENKDRKTIINQYLANLGIIYKKNNQIVQLDNINKSIEQFPIGDKDQKIVTLMNLIHLKIKNINFQAQ